MRPGLPALLRRGELAVYMVVLAFTAALLLASIYVTASRMAQVLASVPAGVEALSQAVFAALSDLFLVVVFVELLDTFVTYVERRRIVVYKIIDVALVALARELFVYLAPINAEFRADKALALTAATFALGVIDYLQRRAVRRPRRAGR